MSEDQHWTDLQFGLFTAVLVVAFIAAVALILWAHGATHAA